MHILSSLVPSAHLHCERVSVDAKLPPFFDLAIHQKPNEHRMDEKVHAV